MARSREPWVPLVAAAWCLAVLERWASFTGLWIWAHIGFGVTGILLQTQLERHLLVPFFQTLHVLCHVVVMVGMVLCPFYGDSPAVCVLLVLVWLGAKCSIRL